MTGPCQLLSAYVWTTALFRVCTTSCPSRALRVVVGTSSSSPSSYFALCDKTFDRCWVGWQKSDLRLHILFFNPPTPHVECRYTPLFRSKRDSDRGKLAGKCLMCRLVPCSSAAPARRNTKHQQNTAERAAARIYREGGGGG